MDDHAHDTWNSELHRGLIAEMLEGFALHEIILDADGTPIDYRFIDVNPAFERITGLARGDVVGHTVREILPEVEQEWIERYGAVALTGEPVRFSMEAGPLGQIFEVRAYRPKPGYFAAMFVDISEDVATANALSESEERYRAVVETAVDGFWLMDGDGLIHEVNQAYLDDSGYSQDDVVGHHVWEFDTRLDRDGLIAHMATLRDAGSAIFHTLQRNKDGTIREIEVDVTYWDIGEGYFFAFLRDTARRTRAEFLIRTRSDLLALEEGEDVDAMLTLALDRAELLTGSAIGFFHLVDDDQEHLTLQSWSTNTVATMCRADGKGQHYPIDTAGVWAEPVRTGMPAIHNDFSRVPNQKGMPEGHAEVTRELIVPILRAGDTVAILGVGNKTSDYGQADIEAVEAVGSMAVDIALHKKSREQFAEYFELVPDLVAIFGTDGTFHAANAEWERVLGYTNAELSTRPYLDFVHPDDVETTKTVFSSVLDGERVSGAVNRYRTKDGEWRRLAWNGVLSADGRVVLAVARDVTDLESARDALEQSQARLSRAVEEAPFPMIIFADDGQIVQVNRAWERTTGFEADEIPDMAALTERLYGEEAELELAEMQGLFRLDAPAEQGEHAFRTKFGEERTWEVSSTPLGEVDGAHSLMMTTAVDVTERRDAAMKLQRAMRTLSALSACNESLVRATNETELLHDICRTAVEKGGYRFAWVGLAEHDESKSVRPVAFAGFERGFLSEVHLNWREDDPDNGSLGRAIWTKLPVVVRSIATDPFTSSAREASLARGFASLATMPLIASSGDAFGAISFISETEAAFDAEELSLLNELAADLEYGIEALRAEQTREQMAQDLATSNSRLEDMLRQVTIALSRAAEARDPYTSGHEERVAHIATRIAAEMGLDRDTCSAVEVSGLVHDIGKLSVPAEILAKPGALSDVEIGLIRGHSQSGHDILSDVDFVWPVAQIVLQHHERMDGTGYPQGLSGETILLPARILGVADVIEAMASHRPYRAARPIEEAIAEITEHPDRYDPDVVAAALRLFARGELLD